MPGPAPVLIAERPPPPVVVGGSPLTHLFLLPPSLSSLILCPPSSPPWGQVVNSGCLNFGRPAMYEKGAIVGSFFSLASSSKQFKWAEEEKGEQLLCRLVLFLSGRYTVCVSQKERVFFQVAE